MWNCYFYFTEFLEPQRNEVIYICDRRFGSVSLVPRHIIWMMLPDTLSSALMYGMTWLVSHEINDIDDYLKLIRAVTALAGIHLDLPYLQLNYIQS